MQIITERKGDFFITTDRAMLDLDVIHGFLSNHAYWCKGIQYETVRKAADHSLNFSVFHQDKQIGYARVISDFATVAYLGDVFILEAYRGQGHSRWLMDQVMTHPDLQGLRRWILLTRDAHELYKKYGWTPIAIPDRWMEKHEKNAYTVNS